MVIVNITMGFLLKNIDPTIHSKFFGFFPNCQLVIHALYTIMYAAVEPPIIEQVEKYIHQRIIYWIISV